MERDSLSRSYSYRPISCPYRTQLFVKHCFKSL